MKTITTILFFFILNICYSQQSLVFDSISIMNGDTTIIKLKCKNTFVYYKEGFTLISSDSRVYSYLLPGTEFFNLQLIEFKDTGKILANKNNDKARQTIIYESPYKNIQIAQEIQSFSIKLIKRNNTAILFY